MPTITPEILAFLRDYLTQAGMTGQDVGPLADMIMEAQVGQPLLPLLTNMSFIGQGELARNIGAQNGISLEDLNAEVTRVNALGQASRGTPGGILGSALSGVTDAIQWGGDGGGMSFGDWLNSAARLGALTFGASSAGSALSGGPTNALSGAGGGGNTASFGANAAGGSAGGFSTANAALNAASAAGSGGGFFSSLLSGGLLTDLIPPLASGLLGSRAAGNASDALTDTSNAGIAEQRRQFDLTREDLAPYRNVGSQAINTLGSIYGYGPDGQSTGTAPDYSAFYASPDYNFRRTEGQRDIGNSFAARGGAASGNALRALSQYNQGLAAGEFGNYFNRQAALSGIGQTATNVGAQVGQNTANNIGNLLGQAGSARASGILGQNYAWQGALGSGLDAWYNRGRPSGYQGAMY